MFDKKQKSCIRRIHLVTDDGLSDRKAFCKVEIVFNNPQHQLFFIPKTTKTQNIDLIVL